MNEVWRIIANPILIVCNVIELHSPITILRLDIFSEMASTVSKALDLSVKILGKDIYSKMGSTMCIA